MVSPPISTTATPQWPEEWRQLRGARIYLDANVWIYALEGEQKWAPLREFLAGYKNGVWRGVTSELSLAESLVWPVRNRDREAQNHLQNTIAESAGLVVVPIRREILVEAAILRATRNLELPDAIHAATAKWARCGWFLTGDVALAGAIHLKVLRVEEFAST